MRNIAIFILMVVTGITVEAQEPPPRVEAAPLVDVADETAPEPTLDGPRLAAPARPQAVTATRAPGDVSTQDVTEDASGNLIFSTLGAERMRITGAGDVGIGTTQPGAALDVRGDASVTGALTVTDGIALGTNVPALASAQYRTKTGTITGYFKITLPQSWSNTMLRMQIDIFDYATRRSRTLILGGYNATSGPRWANTFAAQLSNDNTAIQVDFGHDGTNCAIYLSKGTSGAATTWSYPQVVVRDFFAGYNNTAASLWTSGWSVAPTTTLGTITSTLTAAPNVSGSGTAAYLPKFSTTYELADSSIFDNGNVGIGTAAPAAKLHVVGNVQVTGSITGASVIGAVYQDVAEWVPATADLPPGTVVVLNAAKNNEVMASHAAYDTSVAGVVSEQPGLLLGVGAANKEMVATTGRVKVRVDARQSPIRVGDLLVTSDMSGTAMRSEPMDVNGRKFHQPGTIIGKALEPLAGGISEILVLLSMQ